MTKRLVPDSLAFDQRPPDFIQELQRRRLDWLLDSIREKRNPRKVDKSPSSARPKRAPKLSKLDQKILEALKGAQS